MHPRTLGARRAARLLAAGALLTALVAVPAVATVPASAASAASAVAAVDVAAAGSSLTVVGTTHVAGSTLTVEYATDRPGTSSPNWIGIYAPGQTPGSGTPSITWEDAPGTSGSVDLALDLAAGEYELFYLLDGGYEQLAGPVAVTVGDEPEPVEGSAIALSATTLQVGETLTVDYATDAPHPRNWIGLYSAGQTPGPVPSTVWAYAPGASGTYEVVLDVAPGVYDVYLLAQDGYDILDGPSSVTVAADEAAPVPGDPSAPVAIEPVPTDVSTDGVLAREGFDALAPTGDAAAADVDGWAVTTRAEWTAEIDQMRGRFSRAHGAIAVADAQQAGGDAFAATLAMDPVPVEGLAAVRLTFDSHYRGAAGQSGVVLASFDGGEAIEVLRLDDASVVSGYDETQMNARQDVALDVPVDAREVAFTWVLTAGEGGHYWAIDSASVHQVQQPVSGVPTQAWVVSDIQGHPWDLEHGIGDLAQLAPDANGLLMVGDIVDSGTQGQWDEIDAVMAATADVRPEQTIAAIGNHERYAAGGFDANRDRFLAFAQREDVYDEYVLEGTGGQVPVIVLGQEFASPTDVAMSDAQVAFLEERLAHWTALDRQVVVTTHFPLGETTSGTWAPNYGRHHQMNDRLTSILGAYPNAVVFSGHTHYPAEQGDWAMQRRTDDGHADGFWSINTMAMHIEWDAVGEDTATRTEVTTGDVNRGSVLDVYDDRLVVTAYDFAADAQLQQVTIPNPLVAFDEQVAAPAPSPEPTGEPEPQPSVDPAPSGTPAPTSTPVDEADAAGGQSGALPQTGADVAWLVALVAAALAAIGGGLLARRARGARG